MNSIQGLIILIAAPLVQAQSQADINWDICFRQSAYPKNSFLQDLLYNRVQMEYVTAWIVLILSSIALIQAIAIFGLNCVHKELRLSPGDILLGSLVFESVGSAHSLIESTKNIVTGSGFQYQTTMCGVNSVLVVLAQYGQFCYIVVYFYYLKKKVASSFAPDKLGNWVLHLTIIIVSFVFVFIFTIFEYTGKTLDGMCGIQYSQMDQSMIILLGLVLGSTYFGTVGYTLLFLRKNIPQNQRYKKRSNSFYRFAILYSGFYLGGTIFVNMFTMVGGLNCEYHYNQKLQVFYSLGDIFQCCFYICIPIIRIQDPYTKSTIKKIFFKKAKVQGQNKSTSSDSFSSQIQDLDLSELTLKSVDSQTTPLRDTKKPVALKVEEIEFMPRPSQLMSIKVSQQRSSMIRVTDDQIESTFVDLIQSNQRTCIMFKVVCGLIIDDKSKYHQIEGLDVTNLKSETNIFEEKKIYQLTDDDFFTHIPNIPPQSFFEALDKKKLPMKMTSYAPILFHSLMFREKEAVRLQKSLDLAENMSRIKQSGTNDGGKSGQFFFFSYDNKLMLKTISNQELRILLQKLPDYYQYLGRNKESLIAKIYGIFQFEGINEQPICFILMKNLGRCSKQCIQRIYDLKGSSYDREVIKKGMSQDLSKVVMKDLDFLKIERQLFISQEDKNYIIQNAVADATFFRKSGLIDYSLIVFFIDWQQMVLNHPEEAEELEKSSQHIYKSTFDENVRYNIGIIDYLQEYDVQKKMEKYSKKFIKFNKDLDTSSQDPTTYANRFQMFIRGITTGVNPLP